MSKMSELSMVLQELKECGEKLSDLDKAEYAAVMAEAEVLE